MDETGKFFNAFIVVRVVSGLSQIPTHCLPILVLRRDSYASACLRNTRYDRLTLFGYFSVPQRLAAVRVRRVLEPVLERVFPAVPAEHFVTTGTADGVGAASRRVYAGVVAREGKAFGRSVAGCT